MTNIDRMVGQLAGGLETMMDANGEPKPGSVLAAAVTATREAEAADAAVQLTEYVCELLDVAPDVAEVVLARFSDVTGLVAGVVAEIDSLM